MADDEPDWKKLGGGGGVSAARNMFKQKEAEAAKDAGSPGSSRGSPGSRSPKSGGTGASPVRACAPLSFITALCSCST